MRSALLQMANKAMYCFGSQRHSCSVWSCAGCSQQKIGGHSSQLSHRKNISLSQRLLDSAKLLQHNIWRVRRKSKAVPETGIDLFPLQTSRVVNPTHSLTASICIETCNQLFITHYSAALPSSPIRLNQNIRGAPGPPTPTKWLLKQPIARKAFLRDLMMRYHTVIKQIPN